MGCQSVVTLGDRLTFSVTTHNPDTGELVFADAFPIYRIYEDETTVPIVVGTMDFLNVLDTTGFYSERIVCSAANGFELARSYTIYIEAEVGGDKGGISYGFTVVAEIVEPPTLAEIWAHDARTLSNQSVSRSTIVASTIEVIRTTTWRFTIRGLGSLAGRTALYFGVKDDLDDADADAEVLIEETANLMKIGAADPVLAANGTLTVVNEVSGLVEVWVSSVETAVPTIAAFWEVKFIGDPGVAYRKGWGNYIVARSVVHAII